MPRLRIMVVSTGRIKELFNRYAAIMNWIFERHDGIGWSRGRRVFLIRVRVR